MSQSPVRLTIEQKLASGGFLDFRREFCPWIGVCAVTGYKLAKAGHVKITKIGRKSTVTALDAFACREALRGAAARRA
jgi:hypothetical protein